MKIYEIIKEQDQTQLVQLWDKFSKENPNIKLALDLIPPTGIATSAVDVYTLTKKGEYGQAAVAALGLIPGVKPLMKLNALRLTPAQLKQYTTMMKSANVAKQTDRAVDTGQAVDQNIQNIKNTNIDNNLQWTKTNIAP